MLNIKEAGQQILRNNPGKFYIFGGPEYGVKCKYIDSLKNHYGGRVTEVDSFQSINDLMSVRHIIPLESQVYIIRYDEAFLSSLKETTLTTIKRLKIIGTVVMIYHDNKALTKCDKFLSEYTISFDTVAATYVRNYLKQDYPELNDKLLDFALKSRPGYKGAQILAGLLSHIPDSMLQNCYDDLLQSSFFVEQSSAEEHIKIGLASKNFKYLIQVLEIYSGDIENLLYTLLNSLVELDRLLVKKYSESSLRPYVSYWTKQDIHNMYMIVFNSLENLRTISSDVESQLVYLFGILQYKEIPSLNMISLEVY